MLPSHNGMALDHKNLKKEKEYIIAKTLSKTVFYSFYSGTNMPIQTIQTGRHHYVNESSP